MSKYILTKNCAASSHYHWPTRSKAGETVIIEIETHESLPRESCILALNEIVEKAIQQVFSAFNYALPFVIVKEKMSDGGENFAYVLINWLTINTQEFQLIWNYREKDNLADILWIRFP